MDLDSALPPKGGEGWHRDPLGSKNERYFDGRRWTPQVRKPRGTPQPPAPKQPSKPASPSRGVTVRGESPVSPASAEAKEANALVRTWRGWSKPAQAAAIIGGVFLAFIAFGSILELTGYETPEEKEERLAREAEEDSSGSGDGPAESAVAVPVADDEDCAPNCVLVIHVVDGDSVETDKFPRVRLIGIDTPEEGKCGDNAATNYTRRELEGQTVRYELGVEEEDQHGRTLAYLFKHGDEMHNLDLVERGLAFALTIPPNTKYAAEFELAERTAKKALKGSWLLCPNGPRPKIPNPDLPNPNVPSGGGSDSSSSGDDDSGDSGGDAGDIPFFPGD